MGERAGIALTIAEEAEALAIELEQAYVEGGLPQMICMVMSVLRALKGTAGAR